MKTKLYFWKKSEARNNNPPPLLYSQKNKKCNWTKQKKNGNKNSNSLRKIGETIIQQIEGKKQSNRSAPRRKKARLARRSRARHARVGTLHTHSWSRPQPSLLCPGTFQGAVGSFLIFTHYRSLAQNWRFVGPPSLWAPKMALLARLSGKNNTPARDALSQFWRGPSWLLPGEEASRDSSSGVSQKINPPSDAFPFPRSFPPSPFTSLRYNASERRVPAVIFESAASLASKSLFLFLSKPPPRPFFSPVLEIWPERCKFT